MYTLFYLYIEKGESPCYPTLPGDKVTNKRAQMKERTRSFFVSLPSGSILNEAKVQIFNHGKDGGNRS